MISSDQIIGVERHHFTQLDSTNAEAKRLLDQGEVKEGTIITSDLQTQGRGQYGRVWESEVGLNVMISIIVAPVFVKVTQQFALNILSSLAVADVISDYSDDVKVKWPNDIYVNDKKIAGILIQNFIQSERIKHSIIGIGINVNQQAWSSDISHVTSLSIESNQQLEKEVIIKSLCKQLDKRYKRQSLDVQSMHEEYKNKLYKKDESSIFQLEDQQLEGNIIGIDYLGRLVIDHGSSTHAYNHGEISQVIKVN